ARSDVSRFCGRSKVRRCGKSVAPTALLFVVDASFYQSVAPMALIQWLEKMRVIAKFQISKSQINSKFQISNPGAVWSLKFDY
ncbi:MAG: hypothetical protein PHX39_10385, partial [Bacteroidales bacterium]|nr:hypothetical protein [Bacteroidales bacterium]